jgi:extracellular factor (EF) 3-hydroxypalmitic acid methyl ester biosynthesis protein
MTVNFRPETKTAKKFRSERIPTNPVEKLEIRIGKEFVGDIKDWSRTGVGFDSAKQFDVNQEVSNVSICYFGHEIFNGIVKIVRIEPSAKSKFGARFIDDVLHIERISSIQRVIAFKAESDLQQNQVQELNSNVCKTVFEMKSYLIHLAKTCKDCEESWSKLSLDKKYEAERAFMTNISTAVNETLRQFNARIDSCIDVGSIKEGSIYHALFEQELTPFFMTSGIGWRAYTKPRKYAGDYEMMNQIYRDDFEGSDLLGKLLHNWITNEASSQTVKYRRELFASEFEKLLTKFPNNQLFLLSVASGPAMEVQDSIRSWSQKDLKRTSFTLLDLDSEALEHAEIAIRKISSEMKKEATIEFVNEGVREIITGRLVLPPQDLIYSAGLFDYLDNTVSKVLVERLYNMLAPKGKMIIGNYTPKNPTKPLCHFMTNWHLIHKTEAEMRVWASDCPDSKVSVIYDPSEINAFIVLERK